METYKIYYNDEVFAETFTFSGETTNEDKQKYFNDKIKKYNSNPNKDYHITINNIIKLKYAIKVHSEMTDITLYFISNSEKALTQHEKLINDFLYYENEEQYNEYTKQLAQANIEVLNNENFDIEESVLTIIKNINERF